ncbi:MAG: hypothetical protein GZ094_18955 [Mariniphaga sp.]|nr:hypothetical protein [Mariniphaga sp.]
MSGLKIPYLKEMFHEKPVNIGTRLITSGAMINIDKINWKEYPHRPDVKVYLGYCDQKLWLNYLVANDLVRAVCREDQEPVWQDSCVEFFVKQGDFYRNFEFNCLGVCLSALGTDRNSRTRLEEASLAQILRFPSLNVESLPNESVLSNWSLTVAIPLELIGLNPGSQFMANFYKCGDKTIEPHYVSWSAIATPAPDFHQPAFFAQVELAK